MVIYRIGGNYSLLYSLVKEQKTRDSHWIPMDIAGSSTASTACFRPTQILLSHAMCSNVVWVLIILPIVTCLAGIHLFMKGRGNGEFKGVALKLQGSGFSLLTIFVYYQAGRSYWYDVTQYLPWPYSPPIAAGKQLGDRVIFRRWLHSSNNHGHPHSTLDKWARLLKEFKKLRPRRSRSVPIGGIIIEGNRRHELKWYLNMSVEILSDHTQYRNHGTNNLLKPIKIEFYKVLVGVRTSNRPLFSSPERRYFWKKAIFFPFKHHGWWKCSGWELSNKKTDPNWQYSRTFKCERI